MQYFPLYMDLKGKPVLVVGGGEVASRKVETLVRAGAEITLVSPELTETLHSYVDDKKCKWVKERYDSKYMQGFVQVWATTDDSDLNHQVHADAKAGNILVNVVDDKDYCDFITPSIVNRGRIQIGISSGGSSPVLVRNIRERLEAALPQNVSVLADFAQEQREEIKKTFPTVEERRIFWERFFAMPELEQADNKEKIAQLYTEQLNHEYRVTMSLNAIEYGSDVELLSIKALRLMQKAELILHPKTCPPEFIDLCRRDAERREYYSVHDLKDKLDKAEIDSVNSICIFMQKGEVERSEELAEFVEGVQVLKVVG
ncbi:siroheme synthase [Vibrio sp. JC009]|uniref:precorrin-2 dehydrogenase/sirohydrochlorin ferrochelatase family protein n=1 Tax=Vibrio sp. JC009 TaxID=2912314 RepID=UPI0023AF8A19|nr:NAD(P)-dependent oxidoreductase [Vibrio sp. JC009]WED23153.1 siroheme synthase [Vibrio sp. JC009]